MDHPVLVALTPGPEGEEALRLGIAMATAMDRPLVLGGVAVPVQLVPDSAMGWGVPPIEPDWLEAKIRDRITPMAAAVPRSLTVTVAVVIAHSVATGIEDLAEQHGAGLIVLGATHRGVTARVIDGAPDIGLLRHAACPVLIAAVDPATPDQPWSPGRIGVAWDDSKEAEDAVRVAGGLAELMDATLVVIHVVSRHASSAIDAEVAERDIHRLLARQGFDETFEIDIRHGRAEDELVSGAAAVELLVVGSRRVGPLRRVAFGSTSAHLAHHTRVPVLVVPRGALTTVAG